MMTNDKSLGSGARKISAYAATIPPRTALEDARDALLALRHGDPKHLTQEHARLLIDAMATEKEANRRLRDVVGWVETWVSQPFHVAIQRD